MSAYLERHHLRLSDVRLSHTYCPVCYERQARAWSLGPRELDRLAHRGGLSRICQYR